MYEMEPFWSGSYSLSGTIVDDRGNMFAVSSVNGDVVRLIDEDSKGVSTEFLANSGGVPNSVAFDKDGGMFICDFGHQAILMKVAGSDVPEVFVKEYEGKQLKGPNTAVFDSAGTLFFTDSGPMGETSLSHKHGSVFMVSAEGILQPLALNCLAHPSGIALSPSEKAVYVCETMNNRVLRFVQRPEGVFHFSVFHQFSGLLGPTSLAVDEDGRLFVGRFDLSGQQSNLQGSEGIVSILSAEGKLEDEIRCPAPEISGVALGAGASAGHIFVSELSSNTIFRVVRE